MQRAAGRSPAAQFCIHYRNLVPHVVDRYEKRVYTYIEQIFLFTADLREDTVMPEYFGKTYDKKDLLHYVGRMDSLAGVRSTMITEGFADGIRAKEVNAGLLKYTVMESRGMDILDMTYRGIPLNFLSKSGPKQRAHMDTRQPEFLRSITGGMLYTCGLTNVGNYYRDETGDDYFHGSMRMTPAENVCATAKWEDGEYVLRVSGEMRQGGLFRENMVLRREIISKFGGKTLEIRNEVENEGDFAMPMMIMLHVNLGFPILGGDMRLVIPSKRVVPMDERAEQDIDNWSIVTEPIVGETEQVFIHEMPDDLTEVHACGFSPSMNLGLGVKFRRDQFDKMLEWKSMGAGDYVCGIQPTNCYAAGRQYEIDHGTLPMIEAGEKKHFDITLEILEGEDEYRRFIEK